MLSLPTSWIEYVDFSIDIAALFERVEQEYSHSTCYPPKHQILRIFNELRPQDVKVVILGQDPYHGMRQANGLAFSVNPGVTIPPSLRNIFKEIHQSVQCEMPNTGDLIPWVKQGVFLLNTLLSVKEGIPESHKNIGWESFTNDVIQSLSRKNEHLVFMLWGSKALEKKKIIHGDSHLILESVHPSPLSAHRGFLGNGHFIKANDFLIRNGCQPINWSLSHQMNISF